MKTLLLPLTIVVGWAMLMVTLSTSVGEWQHSQQIIMGVLNRLTPEWASHLSSDQWETLNFGLRKLAHFTEYAVLFSLGYWFCRARLQWSRSQAALGVVAAAMLFAITDEWHQSFVPGRTAQIRDVLIDSSGALTAALIALAKPSLTAQDAEDPSA